uniref:apoptosis inducing factor mitochondria associated 4 n=1 Tax=Pristiophorus japonicus TaxID=55135 RepID=UPI00398F120F
MKETYPIQQEQKMLKHSAVDLPALSDSDAQNTESPDAKQGHKSKMNELPDDLIAKEICSTTEMQDGEMREIEIENRKVLLIKSNGEFSAVGHLCAHYGSSLVNGVLSNGRIRCPKHGACFNIKTGDIEEFPSLDCLQSFKVDILNDKVIVSIRLKAFPSSKRTKAMISQSPKDKHVILIIGGGPAAVICAETLRQERYKGRIIIATKDQNLPYDRPKLSKALNAKLENILLRKPEFYSTHGIQVLTNKEAISVNTAKRRVAFKDGTTQQYDFLLIATGSEPRVLSCPGVNLENVLRLRTLEDANKINELSVGKDVAIVGSSFIGMEIASYLANVAKSVSVIGTNEAPFQHLLGLEVSTAIMKAFEKEHVKFYMRDNVVELRGENGLLKEVVLESRKVLPADVCVMGIGVAPMTHFLKGSGINTNLKGSVVVDQYMRTNVAKVFAAGDITLFPLSMNNNKNVNISHWQMAHMQGRIAALNMLKRKIGIKTVPFFWTSFLGTSLRFAGHGAGYEEIIIHGDLLEMKFVVFYIKEDVVVAVASMNYDPVVAQVAEVLASGQLISKQEAEAVDMPWIKKI